MLSERYKPTDVDRASDKSRKKKQCHQQLSENNNKYGMTKTNPSTQPFLFLKKNS